MPGIYLAAPSTVEAPAVVLPRLTGLLGMRWEGPNGTTWDLLGSAGVVVLDSGIEGMGMPPAQANKTESAALPGSRYRSTRVLERPVFWPVMLFEDATSQAWVEYDRAWWRSLDFYRSGRWVVVHPDGTERHLSCRFLDDGNHSFARDPSRQGWEVYGVNLVADDDPFWRGQPVERTFTDGSRVPFFTSPGGGSVVRISSGSSLASAAMPNPGEIPAWPRFAATAVDGPIEQLVVGVGSQTIRLTRTVPQGQTVVVDMDPAAVSVVSDGQGNDLGIGGITGLVSFAPVPVGESVPLTLQMLGAGTVTVSLTPGYYRAW